MARRLDKRRSIGGSLKLRELIEEHKPEFAYDFRTRFGVSIEEVGRSVSYLEAIYLTSILRRDPSSWVQAALSGWKYPVSREWILQRDSYDLLARVNSKQKPKPYPAPWPDEGTKRIVPSRPQSRSAVISALDRMNPKEESNG